MDGIRETSHLSYYPYTMPHHQMESQAEEQSAETQKERKMRERNEQHSRQLEEELERLKVSGQTRDSSSDPVCVLARRMSTPHLLLHPVEASRLLHSTDLCGPGSGGGTPARRLGEEDAAVRGGAGAQGSSAQHRAEGSSQRAARRGEPTPCAPEGGPGSQRQAGEKSP